MSISLKFVGLQTWALYGNVKRRIRDLLGILFKFFTLLSVKMSLRDPGLEVTGKITSKTIFTYPQSSKYTADESLSTFPHFSADVVALSERQTGGGSFSKVESDLSNPLKSKTVLCYSRSPLNSSKPTPTSELPP